MQRGTLNQGISTTFVFNSIYFYIGKFSCIEQAYNFLLFVYYFLIVEISIGFYCLNILVPLTFICDFVNDLKLAENNIYCESSSKFSHHQFNLFSSMLVII
jgi:hypothetical protein